MARRISVVADPEELRRLSGINVVADPFVPEMPKMVDNGQLFVYVPQATKGEKGDKGDKGDKGEKGDTGVFVMSVEGKTLVLESENNLLTVEDGVLIIS